MSPAQVKRKLKEKKLTYYKLAKRWRVTSSMVSDLINKKTKSARLERRLADELGVSIEEIRGERAA